MLEAEIPNIAENAPAEEFESLPSFAEGPLASAIARVDTAFCAVQDIANEEGIEADVGCEET